MKKTLTIILLLLSVTGFGQIANVLIMGDTTANGSKFRYRFAGEIHISVADSVTTDAEGNSIVVPGYISLKNSRAEIIYTKTRIVNGDTIVKKEGSSVPLGNIATRYSTFINSAEFKRAFKQAIRSYSIKKPLTE